MFDGRLLLVAALVASPAAWRATQGVVSVSEAMTRYLLIALGCVVVSVVVRALWPLVAGEPAAGTTPGQPALAGQPTTAGAEGLDATAVLPGDLDVEGFGALSAFDDLDSLELS